MNSEQAKKIMDISKITYELIAGDFSATRNRVWPEMEILVKKYVRPWMKVLDLGCGNGRFLEVMPEVEYWGVDTSEGLISEAKRKSKIIISPLRPSFSEASNQTQNPKSKNFFRTLDMLELERLGEKDFDVVFMFASLNHIAGEENRHKVLEEVRRILKPGGVVVVTNWNMWQVGEGKSIWKYKIQFPRHKIQDTNKFQIQNPNFQSNPKSKIQRLDLGFKDVLTLWQSGDKKKQGELYYRAFRLGELRGLLDKAGFEVVENCYSLDGERAHWWNGKNIVTVGKVI
ncbi:class I SAM-dependent methyltransferase [Candidatus Kuenenbacteria bacterium]|nr:class I SAM-dependent methyltransferase [Candidatus Kuenenbacteria bacterium]